MNISRRSFLKMAGLTTVAVAGASMFAACSVASHLEVEIDDKVRAKLLGDKVHDKDANDALDQKIAEFNKGLAMVNIPFVNKLSVAQIKSAFEQAAAKLPENEEYAELKKLLSSVAIVTEEGKDYVESDGNFIGTIKVKLTVNKETNTAALCL